MPQLATNWDREQVLALPEDGQRHELVDGRRPGDTRPEILIDRLEWQPDPAQEPMVIDLAELFAEIGEA